MAGDGVAPSRLLHNALLAAYAASGDLEVRMAALPAFLWMPSMPSLYALNNNQLLLLLLWPLHQYAAASALLLPLPAAAGH